MRVDSKEAYAVYAKALRKTADELSNAEKKQAFLDTVLTEDRKTVVFISGVWDLLHEGHKNVLKKASELGDVLIVGVITNKFVFYYKGVPYRTFERRLQDVFSLPYVDIVVPHDSFDDIRAIDKYDVTIRAVGPEYGDHKEQRECLVEMEMRGVKVVTLPRTPGISTSQLKEQMKE